MSIKPFALERYFAKYEFSAPYLLSCSDCEALTLRELLEMADSQTLEMWNNLKLSYTESSGHPVLRKEISKLYKTITADEALVVVPEEGILIAMNNILKKGDHVITTFPGYQSLYEIAESLDCKVSKWTPKREEEFIFDINDLKAIITNNTKLIVINFPHNPTGAMLKENEFREIMNIAEQNNIIVFSDEMYRFLEHDSSDRLPSACDLYENAISLFGMSKSFALPGLRIGWLTTKNRYLMEKFSLYKDYTSICNSAPSEILAIIGLSSKDKILHRNLDIIKNNLTLLDDFFNKYSDIFEWRKPKAGPIAFPKLKMDIPIEDFCLDLVNKKGVMLLPSDVYNYKYNNFRIGFARKNMSEALNKLKDYLQAIV
jgi:aspartate/methionine/tyrosine aminotransferase